MITREGLAGFAKSMFMKREKVVSYMTFSVSKSSFNAATLIVKSFDLNGELIQLDEQTLIAGENGSGDILKINIPIQKVKMEYIIATAGEKIENKNNL